MNFKFIIYIFYTVGIALFLLGIVLLYAVYKQKQRCTVKTVGIIKDIVRRPRKFDAKVDFYDAKLEFFDGKENVICALNYSSAYELYKEGEKINIYYNPKNSREFYRENDIFVRNYGISFIFFGIAVMIFAFVFSKF